MLHIRVAAVAEVADLQKLNDEVFIDNHTYDPDLDMEWARSDKGKEYFTQLLNNPNACCLIAEDNGTKIGYIAAGPKSFSYRKSRYLEIENMGVIPHYRSQGVGTKLIQECLRWAKTQGFQKVYVQAYFANKKAISFYKRNGLLEIDAGLEIKL